MVEIEPSRFASHDMYGSGRKLARARSPEPASLPRRPIAEADGFREVHRHTKPIEQPFNRTFQAGITNERRILELLDHGFSEA